MTFSMSQKFPTKEAKDCFTRKKSDVTSENEDEIRKERKKIWIFRLKRKQRSKNCERTKR